MKQFLIIGCGRFGSSIAKTLYNLGHDVMIVDSREDIVQSMSNFVTHAIQADGSDENVLKTLGISNFDVVVVSIGTDIQSSTITTLVCKELGAKHLVAKAQDDLHAKVLDKIGADRIVFPERDMGSRVAHNLASSNILDYIELAPDYSIIEIVALAEWKDKTLMEASIRTKYGVNVMAIKHEGYVNVAPHANDVIYEGAVLVVVGHNDALGKLEHKCSEEPDDRDQ